MLLRGAYVKLSGTDQETVRRLLARYPDVYTCQVSHTPGKPWVFRISRGAPTYILTCTQPDLDACLDEVRAEVERGLRAIEAGRTTNRERENTPDYTLQDYITDRLGDHERGMSRVEMEQALEAGELSGLEFLRQPDVVRPGESLFLPGKSAPVIDHLKSGR